MEIPNTGRPRPAACHLHGGPRGQHLDALNRGANCPIGDSSPTFLDGLSRQRVVAVRDGATIGERLREARAAAVALERPREDARQALTRKLLLGDVAHGNGHVRDVVYGSRRGRLRARQGGAAGPNRPKGTAPYPPPPPSPVRALVNLPALLLFGGLMKTKGGGCARWAIAMAPRGVDWEAFLAARRVTSPVVEPMVKRNSLNVRPMRDFCRFARSLNWELDKSLVSFVRKLFTGFGNDKFIEDALSRVRDSESRAASSKHMAPWRVWQAPHAAGQYAQYDMDEINLDGVVPLQDLGDVSSLFAADVVDTETLATLRRIRGEQDWMTFDAMSARRQAADHHLHRVLASTQNWPLSNTAWRSALVPARTFVRVLVPDPIVVLVLYASESAFLGWPAARTVGTEYVVLDCHAPKLQWHSVHDLDSVQVLPHHVRSPLHAFLDGTLTDSNMGLLTKLEEPVPLLDYLVSVGFAGVSEGLLKKLFGVKSKSPLPEQCIEDLDYDTTLAVTLMKELKPNMTTDESKAALMKRFSTKPDDDWNDHLDLDDIEKVVSSSDKEKVREFDKGLKAKTQLRDAIMSSIASVTENMFKKGSGKAVAKKAVAQTHQQWWNQVKGDFAWLDKNRPPVGGINVDDTYGRFQLTYPGFAPKSVAWTRRGMEVANVEACRVMWEWHCKATGGEGRGEINNRKSGETKTYFFTKYHPHTLLLFPVLPPPSPPRFLLQTQKSD